MTQPIRIQRKREKGWRVPPNTVYVGRPTVFGNPFKHPDPAEAAAAFRKLATMGTCSFQMSPSGLQFAQSVHPATLHWGWSDWLQKYGLPAIRGKNLACWCPLDKPCHADILLELANR